MNLEIHSLTAKLVDLVIQHEALVDKEWKLQQTVNKLNKSGDKLIAMQIMQRDLRNKSGIGFARKSKEKKKLDCDITFVKTHEKP